MNLGGLAPMHDREFDPADPGLPVDIATLVQLRDRVQNDQLMQLPGRVYFHVVIICTGGEGLHEVDFTPVALHPGRVVHVQPGQVHRWRFGRNYEATIVFFRDDDCAHIGSDGWPIGPRSFDLGKAEQRRNSDLINLMLDEYDMGRSTESRNRALRGALQLLIVNLGLDQKRQSNTTDLPKPYIELMDQLEQSRGWSRSVKGRAELLGYSSRTLTRACQAAVGLNAKEVIDSRVMLEARRLLVHSDNTVEGVARELSFSEASNFAKFFSRMTGENPESWRTRHTRATES